MIARDSHTRDGPSARARRSDSVHNRSGRRNPDKRCGKDRPFAPEARNIVGDNLAHEPRVYVIPATIGGIRGAIVARFIDFRPFHNGGIARG